MRKVLAVFMLLAVVAIFAAEKYVWFDEKTPYLGSDAKGKYGGRIVVASLAGPRTMNYTVAKETSSTDIIALFMGYGGTLVELDNYARLHPAIAKRCEVELTDEGKMIITFWLREGIKWSDGQPFTADDFVFTVNDVYANPKIPSSTQDVIKDSQGRLPKAEKVDNYTVRIIYEEPFRLAVRYIGGLYIWPKHIAEQWVKDGTFQQKWTVEAINNKELVGLGPFIPVEYVPDQYVRSVRNPNYWKKDSNGNQLPYLDEFVTKILPDLNAIKLAFENGEIDIYGVTAQFYPEIKAKAKEKNWVVGTGGPTYGTTFITFNWNHDDPVKRSWFRNEYFRKAVAYSMDKEAMIDTLLAGLGVAQWGPVAVLSPYYNEDVLRKYPYDLDYARMMLQLGGFSWDKNGNLIDANGNKVEFILSTNAGNIVREGMCNIIRDALGKLGIKVTFVPLDFNLLVQKMLNTTDWEAIVIGLTGSDEPQGGRNVWAQKGTLHFWNFHPDAAPGKQIKPEIYEAPDWELEIERIFAENIRILDQKKVYEMFSRFQELVSEHLPLIYTVQQRYLYAHKADLNIIDPNAFGGMLWTLPWIYWKK